MVPKLLCFVGSLSHLTHLKVSNCCNDHLLGKMLNVPFKFDVYDLNGIIITRARSFKEHFQDNFMFYILRLDEKSLIKTSVKLLSKISF